MDHRAQILASKGKENCLVCMNQMHNGSVHMGGGNTLCCMYTGIMPRAISSYSITVQAVTLYATLLKPMLKQLERGSFFSHTTVLKARLVAVL